MSPESLSPIVYRTLNDLVTEQLRSAILGGRLPPGTALNQRDIAHQLSVSRMPVREAFRALEIEGLIRGLPRRKAIVVSLQPEDVADIFDILATLEARAAERAAISLEPEALARVRALANELGACPADVDATRVADLDLELHLAICQPPTSRLRLLIQTHRNAIRPYLVSTNVLRKRRKVAEAEHAGIVAALDAKDPLAASTAAGDHARGEGHQLVEALRSARSR